MGVKNRYTAFGLETEVLPLPEQLYRRIAAAEDNLKKIVYPDVQREPGAFGRLSVADSA